MTPVQAKFHPPPSQEYYKQSYPQSSYPPYPQSYWTTPPPGEGPPTSWSPGATAQSAGFAVQSGMAVSSTAQTGPPPCSSTVQTGIAASSTVQTAPPGSSRGQTELTGYLQQWAATGV